MTLDDAIAHHEWAVENDKGDVATRHWQHAMWLRELKQLREERDEMRTNVTMAILWQDTLKTTIDRLRAENDKLRELVKDVQGFHECGKNNCSACPLFYECSKSFEGYGCSGYAIIHDRMRALGIEVDG